MDTIQIGRGSTPTLKFRIPFNTKLLDRGYLTFSQNNIKRFEKSLSDCLLKGNYIITTLSQEDTLSLNAGRLLKVQLRGVTKNGTAVTSEHRTFTVLGAFKEGEI